MCKSSGIFRKNHPCEKASRCSKAPVCERLRLKVPLSEIISVNKYFCLETSPPKHRLCVNLQMRLGGTLIPDWFEPPESLCFQPLPKSVLAQEHLCVQASRCKITCATRHPFVKVSVCKKCPCIDVFLCRNHLCVRLFVCKRFCVKVTLCQKILIQKNMYLCKSSPV